MKGYKTNQISSHTLFYVDALSLQRLAKDEKFDQKEINWLFI